jgi:dihydrofolate reductase
MRKLVVLTFVSLDGVMQAPGGKGEDPSGGFKYEGWTVPYFDDTTGKEMGVQMSKPFDLLLGKKTYEIFAGYWPRHKDVWPGSDTAIKYVVADGGVDTTWEKTVQIKGDEVVSEIKKLKSGAGPMLQVYGSSNLIQTLLKHDLVDELWLKTFPVTLGKGKRLFGEGTIPAAFKLTKSMVSPSGVIFAYYKRAGDVKVGTFRD